jgi:hypothetical protein
LKSIDIFFLVYRSNSKSYFVVSQRRCLAKRLPANNSHGGYPQPPSYGTRQENNNGEGRPAASEQQPSAAGRAPFVSPQEDELRQQLNMTAASSRVNNQQQQFERSIARDQLSRTPNNHNMGRDSAPFQGPLFVSQSPRRSSQESQPTASQQSAASQPNTHEDSASDDRKQRAPFHVSQSPRTNASASSLSGTASSSSGNDIDVLNSRLTWYDISKCIFLEENENGDLRLALWHAALPEQIETLRRLAIENEIYWGSERVDATANHYIVFACSQALYLIRKKQERMDAEVEAGEAAAGTRTGPANQSDVEDGDYQNYEEEVVEDNDELDQEYDRVDQQELDDILNNRLDVDNTNPIGNDANDPVEDRSAENNPPFTQNRQS